MLAAPTQLGPYRILGPLGSGGMGEVYRARDTRLGREVAVKVLLDGLAGDAGHQARFEREARAVAALSHPNILAIHDYGTDGGITYAVMELLEGETLRSRLARGPLPWREAGEIGAAIGDGLSAAHSKGIVHRDVKPENVFLTTDGRVKILDFGLARVEPHPLPRSETAPYMPAETVPGTVLGTMGYMSPEQLRGEPAQPSSDIFSFGCVLYEMVTGQRAFDRKTPADMITAVLHEEPAEPTQAGHPLPAELVRILKQCLAKDPGNRLPSARDLALSLRGTVGARPLERRAAVRLPSRRLGIVAALVLCAASAYFVAKYARGPGSGGAARVARAAIEALAVLPFELAGGDVRLESLGDGLADHIINSLLQVRPGKLKVRPLTSVSRYRRQNADVSTMGRDLNVQMLVTGTLEGEGDDLTIRVELVDARHDNRLWGKRYQGKRRAIMDLQDEIAKDVAANLRLSLTDEEMERLTRRFTNDPEAYFLYREGIYHHNKFTLSGLETSIDCFRRALAMDPNYAPAIVGMARSKILVGTIHLGPRNTHPEARDLLSRALAIDDTLGSAHAAMAAIHLFHDWDWEAAERALEQAIALGSELSAYNLLGFLQSARGQPREALTSFAQGQELDPLAAPRRHELAMCHGWMRQYDRAIAEAKKALELDPNFALADGTLGLAYMEKGMHAKAIEQLNAGLSRGGHRLARIQGLLGRAHALAGNPEEARKVAEDLARDLRYGCPLALAQIHAALGDKDRAFEWLRKACDERDPQVLWLKVDPTMDTLRFDPRFAKVLEEMGLEP